MPQQTTEQNVDRTGSQFAVTNPATNQIEERFSPFTDIQVATAIDKAQQTYMNWRAESTENARAKRAKLLAAVADLHIQHEDELADIIHHEMGKTPQEGRDEVEFSANIYRYYAEHGPELLRDVPIRRQSTGSAMIRKEPIGVLLGIMPWNYPYYQVARFAGPNLVLGNTVLLKHAPMCPKSAAAIERIFLDAGFPEGAYTNVYADFRQAAAIIADPRVRGVSLTGSERAGRQIAQEAGAHLKKVVCELGGNDPFVLLGTDNVDATVQSAIAGRFENVGQICNGAKRFIVIHNLYDEFLAKFKAASSQVQLAPLCSVAAAERLSAQVHRALDAGAKLILGSADNDGAYFKPTILADIPQGAQARHEEFFGPVSQFYRAASEREAVAIANDTPYGLGSYVFTTDSEQAIRVADQIEAGMVYINEVGADSAELPFGGVKNSGFGREMGTLGIDQFINKKLITIDRDGMFG